MPAREIIKKQEKKDFKLLKKMIRQIIGCLLIYAFFYLIVNNNYIFSEDFTKKAKEILAQDIDFIKIYSWIYDSVNKINIQPNEENQETKIQENLNENIQNNNENIGGAEEILTGEVENADNSIEQPDKIEETENVEIAENVELSQEEKDINYIKETINFIKPIEGKISSMFGPRNPTTPTVPKNHTGTDIAAETGTKIVSATDGTVVLASSKGDYGKHLKIQINDVMIVYAHCNKLYVKEGDSVKQGQEIAEVGATGNVTGPHLHFEIRYQDRYIDPQSILEL